MIGHRLDQLEMHPFGQRPGRREFEIHVILADIQMRFGRVTIGHGEACSDRYPQWLRLARFLRIDAGERSEEHTSELQSLMRISYAVFCLKKKININTTHIDMFI